jgi:uncharacterized protein YraI
MRLHGWITRGCLIASLITTVTVALAVPAFAATARTAVVVTSGTLNARAGPGTNFARVRTVRRNTVVTPTCQVRGQAIKGSVRTSAMWDWISGGGYVSDGYLRWRGSRPGLPTCAGKTGVNSSPTPPAKPMTHDQFLLAVGWPARMTARRYGVPASVTVAQAILESGWGASGLSTVDKNYFGIKCFNNSPGTIAVGCHTYNTHECGGGRCWPTTAAFRVYGTLGQSIDDHGHFLVANSRYKPAFKYSRQPDRFAVELKKAGYATSPTYAQNLIKLMKQYNLYRWDI